MQFPHLGDTRFPNLGTVNVYEFQNEFDYTRWSEKTKIKLCNVLWNSDYADVVKFDTDLERDEWFDSLTDVHAIELETAARVVPEGYVKLPLPYDVMAKYNYLFIDMPIATSNVNRIDYETTDGVRRWYFFIDNIVYLSPNATQVYISPDIWTIYQNEIDIRYMLLERGHAPVAASDTDTYLANPITNNKYLLAPDVSFDNAGINRSADYVPFGNGEKWVCFASTCAPEQLISLGVVTDDSNFAPFQGLSYSDINTRYGHQLQVDGFTMGDGRNFLTAVTPAKTGHSDNNLIANNVSVYAIRATECYGSGTFFADIMAHCPQFLNTIQACFVVDGMCLILGSHYNLLGHEIYRCIGSQQHLLTKQLTKADFNYPTRYQRFAKLYTSPYAQLEITDNDGSTFIVNIEETSTLNVEAVVSTAFPYINMRVFIDGIGGTGSTNYTWADLTNNIDTLQMSNSDWFKYCFDWKIPTFALFMDGETAYQLNSFNRNVRQGINNALVAYHNSMRTSNTAYENACDSADTAYTNTCDSAATNRDNSYNSADTGKVNSYNNAEVTKSNGLNTADTTHTNAVNSGDNARKNADNIAELTYTNAECNRDLPKITANRITTTNNQNTVNTLQTNIDALENNVICQSNNVRFKLIGEGTSVLYQIAVDSNINSKSQSRATDAANYANAVCQYTTDAENQKTTACAIQSNLGNIVSGAISGAQTSSIAGLAVGGMVGSVVPVVGNMSAGAIGAVGGAVLGAVAGGVSAAVNQAGVGVVTDTKRSIANAQCNYNSYMAQNTNSYSGQIQDYMNGLKTDTFSHVTAPTETDQQNNIATTSRNAGTAQAQTSGVNATNIANAENFNATDGYNVANKIAVDTKNASGQNNYNSQETVNKNADNSRITTYKNIDNSYNVSRQNADNTRLTAKTNALNTYNTSVENAGRTRDTVKDNAQYTRQVNELNAKELLENAAHGTMAGILDARNAAPRELCSYSGNPDADYMRTRGIQIKVKTQSDSAICQAGDIFARYGYAYNQFWDVHTSGLKLMNYFTYWKAEEIWIDARNSSNNKVETFMQRLFIDGVTIWNSPTEIGRVDVYAN